MNNTNTVPVQSAALYPSGVTGRSHPTPVFRPSQDRRSSAAASALLGEGAFEVVWARHQDEVREAQALRHQVFCQEMGASLRTPAGTPEGLDVDLFDDFCEHLLVRTLAQADQPDSVIGTYRVLTPEAARRAGGYYSETEFDLTRLRPLRSRMAELGRSCVHADHRSGGVILALWGALASFMHRNQLDAMVGCASVGMRDGGHAAASLWRQLSLQHLIGVAHQVRPRLALPVEDLDQTLDIEPPPLIRGYLRVGAKVLGAPAWDPDFNTADLPMLMRLEDLPARYRRHFLG
jgi:putative hemolysin